MVDLFGLRAWSPIEVFTSGTDFMNQQDAWDTYAAGYRKGGDLERASQMAYTRFWNLTRSGGANVAGAFGRALLPAIGETFANEEALYSVAAETKTVASKLTFGAIARPNIEDIKDPRLRRAAQGGALVGEVDAVAIDLALLTSGVGAIGNIAKGGGTLVLAGVDILKAGASVETSVVAVGGLAGNANLVFNMAGGSGGGGVSGGGGPRGSAKYVKELEKQIERADARIKDIEKRMLEDARGNRAEQEALKQQWDAFQEAKKSFSEALRRAKNPLPND